MRRSFGADRGQKQGASYLLGFQNNPQKIRSIHLRPVITEAYPTRSALRANIPNQNAAPPPLASG
jgi:hypothetical protein